MAKLPQDQEFLEFIVKHLVDNPSAVKTDRKVDEMGVLLSLHVPKEEMGKIIGRDGSTARAVRTLLRIIGLKNHARINLKIVEPAEDSSQGSGKKALDDVVEELNL